MNGTVLLVDDEPALRFTLSEIFDEAGYRVLEAPDGASALTTLDAHPDIDAVLTDLVMPGIDGLELLRQAARIAPDLPVILLTARGSERIAVEALKRGAYDYLTKPFDLTEVLATIGRAVEASRLRRATRRLEAERAVGGAFVAQSDAMRRVLTAVERVARRDVTVLVRGETGTGKELVGSLLHAHSPRAKGPLVRFNCAALAPDLVDAELFGHVKGAFTGAHTSRPGYIKRAHGGTLILDEAGDLDPAAQAKLLRVLQAGEVQPVGASRIERVDVRFVACTHRDLKADVHTGRFRADLYYRLAVIDLEVPPLRHRRDDIAPLTDAFRARYAARFGLDSGGPDFDPSLRAALHRHDWPGNVRELENTVARLLALWHVGPLTAADLRLDGPNTSAASTPTATPTTYRAAMDAFERDLLQSALDRADGNRSQAARDLDIARTTLIDKLKRHGLYT